MADDASPSPVDLDAAEKDADYVLDHVLPDIATRHRDESAILRAAPTASRLAHHVKALVSLVRSQSRGIEELQGRLIEAIGRAERAEAERDAAREALSRAEAERKQAREGQYALISLCIGEFKVDEATRYEAYQGFGLESKVTRSWDLAIAAVRRAAGLEGEGP